MSPLVAVAALLVVAGGVHGGYTPAPGPACAYGRCAVTKDEEYIHPSLNFTYIHSDTLCTGMFEHCAANTNHTTICSRTSLGPCHGRGIPEGDHSVVPSHTVNFERVGFFVFNKDYYLTSLLHTEEQAAECDLEAMVREQCGLKNADGSLVLPYAVADRSHPDRIKSGFQNAFSVEDENITHKMEGSIVEDYPGLQYFATRSSLNWGPAKAENYTPVAYAIVDDLQRDEAGLSRFWADDGKMEALNHKAPHVGFICVRDDVGVNGECAGEPRVFDSGDFMFNFFLLNSGDLYRMGMMGMYGMTHGAMRLKFWVPDTTLDMTGMKINGGYDFVDGTLVRNFSIPMPDGWLTFTMPPKYHYGVKFGDEFIPSGTKDVLVYCAFLSDGDYPIMYFDFAFDINDGMYKDQYVSYSVNVKATLNDPDGGKQPSTAAPSSTTGATASAEGTDPARTTPTGFPPGVPSVTSDPRTPPPATQTTKDSGAASQMSSGAASAAFLVLATTALLHCV